MLIIEGPDLVGKTTLAKKLAEGLNELGYIYRHLSKLPSKFDRYHGHVGLMFKQCVQDRFHMSDVIYRKVEGELWRTTPTIYKLLDAKLMLMGSCIVVITCDPEMLEDRMRPGEMYSLEKIKRANNLYRDFCNPHTNLNQQYQPRIDVHIECTPDKPYATENDVQSILAMYLNRLRTIKRLVLEGTLL